MNSSIGDAFLGKVPPHSNDAELAVIGGIILHNKVLDLVAEHVAPTDFYSEAHELIYQAILDLDSIGRPIDLISLGESLKERGELESVGGLAYLSSILDNVPTSANIEAYSEIVQEKSAVRSAIGAALGIVQKGYGDYGDATTFLDEVEQSIFEATRRRDQGHLYKIDAAFKDKLREIERLRQFTGNVSGLPTGWADLDSITTGLQSTDLIILAGRPSMGKTAFALKLATNVLRLTDKGVAIFSLEMSVGQLVGRLLTAESTVPSQTLRVPNRLTREDMVSIVEVVSDLSVKNLYIDDSAAPNVMEIRSRARYLKSKVDLGLIVVDYLQIMKAVHRNRGDSSREREIAEITRSLKALAKELELPVLVLSQLNRSPELRADKRPQMSDLRECVALDTLIPDALTGARRRALDWVTTTGYVAAIDGELHVMPGRLDEAWGVGTKDVVLVRLRSGRTIRCTRNHPILAVDGPSAWFRHAERLRAGDIVATAKRLPEPLRPPNPYTADELRLLGYLVCDGSYLRHRSVGYVKADLDLVDDVNDIVWRLFGVRAKPKPCQGEAQQFEYRMDTTGPNANPLIQWLKRIGMHGQTDHDKELPEDVFESDNHHLAILLGAIWAGDGSVVRKGRGCYLKFTSSSTVLIDQVQWLLMRLGIGWETTGPHRNTKSTMDLWETKITVRREMESFASCVPMPGEKGRKLKRILDEWPRGRDNDRHGRLPVSITDEVARRARERGLSWRELGYRCQGKRICQADLGRCAAVLNAPHLTAMASPDVYWDEVVDVVEAGQCECFDFSVPDTGAFIANGIVIHNSGAIEQDADLILFLYRDAFYTKNEQDTTTEVIIGKNRNGPVGTIRLAFIRERVSFEAFLDDTSYQAVDYGSMLSGSQEPAPAPEDDGTPF